MDVIRITLHSDLCAGNGESRGNAVDTDIVLTAAGLPRIPARRLKGCLRAAAGELAAHQVDLPDQPVQIAVAGRPVILDLAIRAEAAQLPAKRDMHIQSQPLTLGKGQLLVVFILKEKGLGRAGQPHPRQVCDDTHDAPQIYFR